MDKDTKAVLDRRFNELMEHMNAVRRDLAHSNELCEKIADENANLKRDLAESNAKVAALEKELAVHKRESAAAIKAAVDQAVAEQKGGDQRIAG